MNGHEYVAFSIARDEVPWLASAAIRLALVRVLGHLAAPDSPAAKADPAEAKIRTREDIEAMTEAEILGHMARPAFRETCIEIAARILAGEPMTLQNVADALGVPFARLAAAVEGVALSIIPGLPVLVDDARETFQ